jgi:acyl dehydratase
MFQNFIRKQSTPVLNAVEKGAVKKFAESIGDHNPLFFDEQYAEKTVHKRLLAPPTFPRTFDYGEIEGLKLPASGLIHGEQQYSYERPLYVGEELYCNTELVDVYEKTGGSGTLTFLTFQQQGVSTDGDIVLRSKRVLIVTEKVKAQMEDEICEVKE